MMELVEELIGRIAEALHGTRKVIVGNQVIDFTPPWKRITFFDAISEATKEDLKPIRGDDVKLKEMAKKLGLQVAPELGAGKVLEAIFGEFVQPNLIQPTFVMDYPIEISPLAKRHRSEDGLVERFELIVNGQEICNAFSELNDPIDQRSRFEDQMRLRAQGDEEAQVLDEDFLRALEYGMPPTAGLGIGIDRLTMILTNQDSIRDVILFPQMRPER